jgi:RNA polymerase sigma-70 factor (ECF subfamily)
MVSDESLCALVARRDVEAFAALHGRYALRVRGVALRRLGDEGQADDLVQEVFLDVWRAAARFDASQARFSRWLWTIAARRITDLERRASSRPPLAARDAGDGRPFEEDHALRIDVATALEALPAAQRDTLRLAFFCGLSYPEIAAHSGLPLGTVKSRALLGMRRLEPALS